MAKKLSDFFDKNELLSPDEPVIWYGNSRNIFIGFWLTFGFLLLGWLILSFLFISAFLSITIVILALLPFVFVILILEALRGPNFVYTLTSDKLIIKTRGLGSKTIICNLNQILRVALKADGFLPHIKLVSPYISIPGKIYPKNEIRELYQALELLLETEVTPTEKEMLYNLYYPPKKEWLTYTGFLTLLVIVFYLGQRLPISFRWGFWGSVCQIVTLLLMIGTGFGRVFSPLFLGKELSLLDKRVSNWHIGVLLGIVIVIDSPFFYLYHLLFE